MFQLEVKDLSALDAFEVPVIHGVCVIPNEAPVDRNRMNQTAVGQDSNRVVDSCSGERWILRKQCIVNGISSCVDRMFSEVLID